MPATFRRLNRKVIDENGEEKFELLATVGVDDTELDIMKGATADVDGVFGLVPTPPKGELNRYLRVDGTWAEPVGDLPSAGSGSSGLMTPEQVKDLQNCVTNITNLTNRLSETSTSLSNRITSVSNSVSSLSTNLSNRITGVSNSVSSLSTKHSGDISSLNGSISSLNGSISTTNQNLNSAVSRIAALETHVTNLIGQTSELHEYITNVNKRITSYHGSQIIG